MEGDILVETRKRVQGGHLGGPLELDLLCPTILLETQKV